MQRLQGVPINDGVAMAVAVVVDVQGGLSGLPSSVLQEGIKALRQNLPDAERPEIIIACDLMAIGSAVRIPGIRTVGIISQGDDQPAIPVSVPCISGVPDLLRSVGNEELVILDGTQGIIYVDPDVQTVIDYQNRLSPEPTERVFLEAAHLAAKTLDGRTVTVSALVSTVSDAESAISQGADALVVIFDDFLEDECRRSGCVSFDAEVEALEVLIALCGGKHLSVVHNAPSHDILNLIDRVAEHQQVIIVSREDTPAALSDDDVKTAVSDGVSQVTVPADAISRIKDLIRTLSEVILDA